MRSHSTYFLKQCTIIGPSRTKLVSQMSLFSPLRPQSAYVAMMVCSLLVSDMASRHSCPRRRAAKGSRTTAAEQAGLEYDSRAEAGGPIPEDPPGLLSRADVSSSRSNFNRAWKQAAAAQSRNRRGNDFPRISFGMSRRAILQKIALRRNHLHENTRHTSKLKRTFEEVVTLSQGT